MRNLRFLLSVLFSFSILGSNAQDKCGENAAQGSIVHRPVDTSGATKDEETNGGACMGVQIGETPGVWFRYKGTGALTKASTCHADTRIKVKISVFSSTNKKIDDETCEGLQCLGVSSQPDFECDALLKDNTKGEWTTKSTKIYFQTDPGVIYYLLVQEADGESGVVKMNFQTAQAPQNDFCVDAIGPVPRDGTKVPAVSRHGSISLVNNGYCNLQKALYPGIWFQVMGNGGDVVLNACGLDNLDGFYFSVYEAVGCDDLVCADNGRQDTVENDSDNCFFSFGFTMDPATNLPIEKGETMDSFSYTFPSKDGYRYYVYLHHARTTHSKVTSENLRFWVKDGVGSGSSQYGATHIKFRDSAYGQGPYVAGKVGKENYNVDGGGGSSTTGGGESGDVSSNRMDRVAVLSAFVSFAFMFM